MLDEVRYSRWKQASYGLFQIEPELVFTVQALGRIDADLFLKDVRYRVIREENNATLEEHEEMSTHSSTMGHLWVLGTYEIIRTLDQIFRNSDKYSEALRGRSFQLKRVFERVRIPLAKLEPAKNHKATDSRVAHLSLIRGRGLGWTVADGVSISRGELSTHFLEFLESLNRTEADS